MWRRFNGFVTKEHLFAGRRKLLLAVSGGLDSVVLLHLMARYARENTSLRLAVVHCNFHLREQESDRDERFVCRLAQDYGVPFFVASFDTETYARQQGISVEMAARELRYGYFSELIQKEGFDACLLAHHADDNAETFFINLFRGSGVKGLRGMLPCSGKEAVYLRPLLFARRAEITAYAEQEGLEHVEDSTNAELMCVRNRVRHEVLPMLERYGEGFVGKLNQSMQTLRLADALISDWFARLSDRMVVRENPQEAGKGTPEFIPMERLPLAGEHQDLFWELYLRGHAFNRQQIEQIAVNRENGISGKRFYNADGSGFLLREPEGWRWLPQGFGEHETGPLHEEAKVEVLRKEDMDTGPDVAYLDFDKLEFPLSWRHWRPGDRFCPLGMKGFRKLSDFFKDLHLGGVQKERAWLLCSGKDIVWVAGYRIDNRYKLDFSTAGRKTAWVVRLRKDRK